MQKKHFLTELAIAGVLATAGLTAAAQNAAERQLIEQGQYWQRRDTVRATEAWNRLLRVQPDSADALTGLGRLAIQAGQAAKAQGYLAQLRKVQPTHPEVALLEQEIAFMDEKTVAALNQARILLRQDNVLEAVKIYRSLFQGRVPQGSVGAEYYSALGYTQEGWSEAVQGLERLQKAAPKNSQLSLNLASLLVLRDPTRVRGMNMLIALSRHPDIGGVATEQWRNVLTWLGAPPPPVMATFFEQYLKANPDDEEIRQQYRAKRTAAPASTGESGRGTTGSSEPGRLTARPVVRIDPFGVHIKAGYDALQEGKVEEAEHSFAAALRLKPKEAAALGGLGLVRLRQESFTQARELLLQAAARGDAAQWKQALDSASYWALVQQARTARQQELLDEAARLLEQAVLLSPGEVTATLELAQIYVALQSLTDAERAFRKVLAHEPDNLLALQGLVGVLASQGQSAQALELIDALPPDVRERIDVARLRAERSLSQARTAANQGEWTQAQSYFEDAISHSPQDAWLRLELARVLQRRGEPAQALQVVDALVQLQGSSPAPEALYVAALLRAERQDWAAALELVERIEPAKRTADMQALQNRAWLQAELARVQMLVQRGELAQARVALAPLHERAGSDANALGAIAGAYVQVGDLARARALLRELMTRERTPGAGLLLQYAGLLLQLGDTHAEFIATLQKLRELRLNAEQQSLLASLERGYGLRQAEALRQRGALAQAYEALRPLLISSPDDPLVLGALARMYVAAGSPGEAAWLYQRILAQMPDDLDTLRGAGQAAAASGELDAAERLYLHALTLAPNDPQLLASLGGLYRQQGRDSKALPLLRQAEAGLRRQLAVQAAPRPALVGGQQPSPSGSKFSADNPFAALLPAEAPVSRAGQLATP